LVKLGLEMITFVDFECLNAALRHGRQAGMPTATLA
jgi:hypothetical protein